MKKLKNEALRRALSFLLAVVMLTSAVPVSVFAAEADGQMPVMETTAPAEETTAPVEETTAPAEETTAPAEETTAPAEETTAPAEETTAPAEETTAPAEETTAPAEETTAPAEETTAPTEETTAPAEETTAPTEETTAPTEEETTSGEETEPEEKPTVVSASISWKPELEEQSAGKVLRVRLTIALTEGTFESAQAAIALTGAELAMLRASSLEGTGLRLEKLEDGALLTASLTGEKASLECSVEFAAPVSLEKETAVEITGEDIAVTVTGAGDVRPELNLENVSGGKFILLPLPAATLGSVEAMTVYFVGMEDFSKLPEPDAAHAELQFSLDGGEWTKLTAEHLSALRMAELPRVECTLADAEIGQRRSYSVKGEVLPTWLPTDARNTEEGQRVNWRLMPNKIEGFLLMDPGMAEEEGYEKAWYQVFFDAGTLTANDFKSEPVTYNVVWLEDNAAVRPSSEAFLNDFKYTFQIDGQGPYYELNAQNLELLCLEEMPKPVLDDSSSNWSLTCELPMEFSYTDENGDLQTARVTWDCKRPGFPGYMKPYGNVSGQANTLYYSQVLDFTGYIEYRDGGTNTLYNTDFHSKFQVYADGEKFDYEHEELLTDPANPNGGSFTMHMPMFHPDGTPVSYYVKPDAPYDSLTHGYYYKYDKTSTNKYEPEDHVEITFENDASGAGALVSELYNGGICIMTRRGNTTFNANKVWLDEGTQEIAAQRPEIGFTLWRYIKPALKENASEEEIRAAYQAAIQSASQVRRDEKGAFLVLKEENGEVVDPQAAEGTRGALDKLPKYDGDGNEYVYEIRESMPAGSNYEQVFGRVEMVNGEYSVADVTAYGDRLPGDKYVYNNGCISNRITETQEVYGEKKWNASALSGEFKDVSVELTLFSKHKNPGHDSSEFEPVLDENGEPVKHYLTDFQSEYVVKDSVTAQMPKYDEMGHEILYWWKETQVYQDADREIPLMKVDEDGNRTATLKQDGRDILYKHEHTDFDEETMRTVITNALAQEQAYDLTKVWGTNRDGSKIEPECVSFSLYQVQPNGQRILYATVEMSPDGEPVLNRENVPENVTLELENDREDPFHTRVTGLPEFDKNGAQYSYMILERPSGTGEKFHPSYNQTFDKTKGLYETTVTNGPGDYIQIIVEKIWLDDTDIGHRGDVQIGVYSKKSDEELSVSADNSGAWTNGVTLNASNGWYQIVTVPVESTEDVYILEKSVGGFPVNNGEVVKGEGKGSYQNDHHQYEVSYQQGGKKGAYGDSFNVFAVTNLRKGNITFKAKKTWIDGGNEDDIRNRIRELCVEPGLHLAYQVSLDKENSPADYQNDKKWDISVNYEDGQEVVFDKDIPAYDSKGARLFYNLREVWLDEEGREAVPTGRLAELWGEYSTAYQVDQEIFTPDGDLTHISITNKRAGTEKISWMKNWKDDFNENGGKRPDLFLNIFRVTFGEDGKPTVPELVVKDYLWEVAPDDSNSNNWIVTMDGMDKYDDSGREYFYYAIERFGIMVSEYDYVAADYIYDGITIGTHKELNKNAEQKALAKRGGALQVDKENDNKYALQSGGTFVNTIRKPIELEGKKIWNNLPNRYDHADLPIVEIRISRYVQGKQDSLEPNVANLTLDDWGAMNNNYEFKICYKGKNTWAKNENGVWECTGEEEEPKLQKYDPDGRLYVYQVDEVIFNGVNKSKILGSTDGRNPDIEMYKPNITGYVLTNPYTTPLGALKFQKHLILPAGLKKAPAVTFKLTRSYTGLVKAENSDALTYGEKQDAVFEKKFVWESKDVWAEYENSGGSAQGVTLNITHVFEDLPRYAPNGSEYKYTIEEVVDDDYGYKVTSGKGEIEVNGVGLTGDGTVTDLLPAENSTAENAEIQATFQNTPTPMKITIKGTKEWDDKPKNWDGKSDILGIRPETVRLTLWHMVESQPGQNNGVDWEPVKDENGNPMEKDLSGDGDTWECEFTGLPRYADNGKAWKYELREDPIPDGYRRDYGAENGLNGEEYSVKPVRNHIRYLTRKFVKTWDTKNAAKYLDIDVTVTFQLQVRGLLDKDQKEWTGWQDADAFFDNNAKAFIKAYSGDEKYSFERTLTGKLYDDVWSSEKQKNSFTYLPTHAKHDDKTVELQYRVVETKIAFGTNGYSYQDVKVDEKGTGYTYSPGGITNPLCIPQSLKVSGDTSTTVNKIPAVELSVTKKWEGDYDNAYDTRIKDQNGSWYVDFKVERRFAGEDDTAWKPVPVNGGNGLLCTITQGANPYVVKDLPKFGIKDDGTIAAYEYRAVETPVGDDGKYNLTYKVDSKEEKPDRDGNCTTEITNTMVDLTEFRAKKTWRGEPTSVTLVLQYRKVESGKEQWVPLASVELDGKADTDPKLPYYETTKEDSKTWTAVWTDVPVRHPKSTLNQDGKTDYRIIEDPLTGYVCDTEQDGNTYKFRNTQVIEVPVTKIWEGDWEDKTQSATVALFWSTTNDPADAVDRARDRHGDVIPAQTLTASNASKTTSYTFKELCAYDENEQQLYYFAFEIDADGEKLLYDQKDFNIIYDHGSHTIRNVAKTEFSVTKKWLDNDDAYGTRPAALTLTLKRKGDDIWFKSETLEKKDFPDRSEWTCTFSNLEKYNKEGVEYEYYVTEAPGQMDVNKDAAESGYYQQDSNAGDKSTLVNVLKGTTSVEVKKEWKDEDGKAFRPETITIELYRETGLVAKEFVTRKVLPDEKTGWEWEFTGLDKYDASGALFKYTVKEVFEAKTTEDHPKVHYESVTEGNAKDGYTIKNTIKEWIDVEVTKTWKDNNNAYGTRPDSIQVALYHGETLVRGPVDVKFDQVNDPENKAKTWKYTFRNLDRFDGEGNEIQYTTKEVGKPDKYEKDEAGLEITNKASDVFSIPVKKVWKDNNNAYGTRPASILIQLWRDDKPKEAYREMTLSAASDWEGIFYDLPMYDWDRDGLKYTYTVTEVCPNGYDSKKVWGLVSEEPGVEGYIFTNTLTGTTEVKGEKTWLDDKNAEGLRPESLVITLKNDGGREEKTFTTDASKKWKYEFTDLDEYTAEGVLITYSVVETPVEIGGKDHPQRGYEIITDGYNITNLLKDKVDVTVTKTWQDDNDADGLRPKSIQIQLYANGKAHGEPVTVTGTGNKWTYTYTQLEKYDENGKAITYTAREAGDVGSYVSSANGLEVTNTVARVTSVSVKKIWKDNGNAYGTRPQTVSISLYANGVFEKEARFTGTGSEWTYTFDNLPMYDSVGKKIVYTTAEDHVPAKYTLTAGENVFTNTLTDIRSIPVRKLWSDNGNAFGLCPDSITVRLYANGVECDQAVLTEADGKWSCSFQNLPKYDSEGVLIAYTVTEDPVEGYETRYNGFVIENVGVGALTVKKEVTGSAGNKSFKFHFTVTLSDKSINGTYGDMVFVDGVASFTLKHGESVTATGLPAGVSYSVKEEEANRSGYTTRYTGAAGTIRSGTVKTATVRNSRNQQKILQTGQLNWPIYLLAIGGMMTMGAGLLLTKKKRR